MFRNEKVAMSVGRMARNLGTAAVGAGTIAAVGSMVDSGISTAKEYINRSRSRSAFQEHINTLSPERKERMFGQRSPDEIMQRYDEMYHLSPQYMSKPSLASTAVAQTLIHDQEMGLRLQSIDLTI